MTALITAADKRRGVSDGTTAAQIVERVGSIDTLTNDRLATLAEQLHAWLQNDCRGAVDEMAEIA